MRKMLVASLAAAAIGWSISAGAAVTESQFPPKTVRDLIALCGAAQDDPMMTAAVNYCHGYAEAAVIVEEAHEKQRRGSSKLFCLPDPPPASGTELSSFATWANADPGRLDQPAIDGMFLYLAQKYPCGRKK